MATQTTTSACPTCACADSPLSITGDLTGILTFALVVWASVVYCFRSFRDFEHEMHDMQHRVQVAFEEAQRLRRTFIERQRQRVPPTSPPRPSSSEGVDRDGRGSVSEEIVARHHHLRAQKYPFLIDEAWVRAEKEMIRASRFVNKRLLKPATVFGVLVRRAVYIVERKRAAETIGRLERAMESVKGIVADVSGK